MGEYVTDPTWGVVVDPADAGEAADLRHLAERVRRDHREGERDHQEVDPGAARCDCTAEEADHGRQDDRDHEGERRVPAEV